MIPKPQDGCNAVSPPYQSLYWIVVIFSLGLLPKRISPEIHLKLKSCQISFVYYIHSICPIVLMFCTEHSSDAAVLCAKYQNNWASEKWVLEKHGHLRFEFKMGFRVLSHIATSPSSHPSWRPMQPLVELADQPATNMASKALSHTATHRGQIPQPHMQDINISTDITLTH